MKRTNPRGLHQSGFSLVELMVALVIGSILIIGAVYVYTRSRASYSVNENISRLQETARYAVSTMEPDVRLANFWGLINDASIITGRVGNVPLAMSAGADGCGANLPIDLARAIDGSNNTYGLACAAGGPTATAQPGADTVIVRHADEASVAPLTNGIQVYSTRQGSASALFQDGNAPGALTVDPRYGPQAEVHDLVVNAYYVAASSSSGNTVPSLRRHRLERQAIGPGFTDEEVIPGVEDLQIQFGIDLGADDNGDGVPDDRDGNGRPDRYNGIAVRYVNPGDPALAGGQIVAVRLWLRIRAEQPEVGYFDNKTYEYADVRFTANDSFRRLLVSRTIQIRNTVNLQT
jgi:type IV pilus assembly protein PilW